MSHTVTHEKYVNCNGCIFSLELRESIEIIIFDVHESL